MKSEQELIFGHASSGKTPRSWLATYAVQNSVLATVFMPGGTTLVPGLR